MRKESSYGIVPIRFDNGPPFIFFVKHKVGWWGFPKGHKEGEETDLEAASRELLEETGLEVESLLSENSFLENYRFFRNNEWIEKAVYYFVATVKNPDSITVDGREVVEGKWAPLRDAERILSFPESKEIIKEIRRSHTW
jgi:bis(5'-nucleosidyl)-tetraphosphatase